jgi:hypothetical protein
VTGSRRALLPVVASAVVLVAGGVGVALAQSADPTRVVGAETAPPWPVPAVDDRPARAELAGLENVWGQDLAMHVHSHLTITVDGEAVTVPGDVGHDAATKFAAPIHTHDTSGIVHVESPRRESFVLGQLFTEWGVHLDQVGVGDLGGSDGRTLTVFVDGSRYGGDPAGIRLVDFEDVALVLAPAGETVTAPPAFAWPDDYR